MELGKAMSLSGMCVALSAALVYDKKTVVLSILGTYFNGIIWIILFLTIISSGVLHYYEERGRTAPVYYKRSAQRCHDL